MDLQSLKYCNQEHSVLVRKKGFVKTGIARSEAEETLPIIVIIFIIVLIFRIPEPHHSLTYVTKFTMVKAKLPCIMKLLLAPNRGSDNYYL